MPFPPLAVAPCLLFSMPPCLPLWPLHPCHPFTLSSSPSLSLLPFPEPRTPNPGPCRCVAASLCHVVALSRCQLHTSHRLPIRRWGTPMCRVSHRPICPCVRLAAKGGNLMRTATTPRPPHADALLQNCNECAFRPFRHWLFFPPAARGTIACRTCRNHNVCPGHALRQAAGLRKHRICRGIWPDSACFWCGRARFRPVARTTDSAASRPDSERNGPRNPKQKPAARVLLRQPGFLSIVGPRGEPWVSTSLSSPGRRRCASGRCAGRSGCTRRTAGTASG